MARKATHNKSRFRTTYAYGKALRPDKKDAHNWVEYDIRAKKLTAEEKPLFIEQDGEMVQYDVIRVIDTARHPLPAKNPEV